MKQISRSYYMRGDNMEEKKNVVEFRNVTKEYQVGEKRIKALDNASFSIERGEFVVILGPSGAGKSTLLNLLGGMDLATSGEINVNGQEITKLKDSQLTTYRAQEIGFVFQFYNLIPSLTAWENVSIVRDIVKSPLDESEVLAEVGLVHQGSQFPAQLSGGEQQRVSIARAIAKNPTLLL